MQKIYNQQYHITFIVYVFSDILPFSFVSTALVSMALYHNIPKIVILISLHYIVITCDGVDVVSELKSSCPSSSLLFANEKIINEINDRYLPNK